MSSYRSELGSIEAYSWHLQSELPLVKSILSIWVSLPTYVSTFCSVLLLDNTGQAGLDSWFSCLFSARMTDFYLHTPEVCCQIWGYVPEKPVISVVSWRMTYLLPLLTQGSMNLRIPILLNADLPKKKRERWITWMWSTGSFLRPNCLLILLSVK